VEDTVLDRHILLQIDSHPHRSKVFVLWTTDFFVAKASLSPELPSTGLIMIMFNKMPYDLAQKQADSQFIVYSRIDVKMNE